MDIHRRKMQVSLGVFGLFTVIIVGILRAGSAELLILSDPRDFLLQESDLPQEGKYVIPPHERHVITNERIVFLLGDDAGEKRIQRTGRVVGWRAHFVRTDDNASVPEDITQSVTQYASAQGAQYNLEKYRLSTLYPETGWRGMDSTLDLGDASLVETRSEVLPYGSRLVSYSITFTYRNMAVRLEAAGNAGQNQLEDLIALAKIVLARVDEAEPHLGPVPTPTPGFEDPEEDFVIYR